MKPFYNLLSEVQTGVLNAQTNLIFAYETRKSGYRAAGSNDSVKESDEAPENIAATEPVAKEGNKNKKKISDIFKPKKNKKTEEEILAEAEAPIEEAGAEIIVEEDNSANMAGQGIPDTPPGVLDFSAFGVMIDTNLGSQPVNPYLEHVNEAEPSIPIAMPGTVAPLPQQPIIMQPPMNPNMQGAPIAPPPIPNPGQGRHKVDNPEPPKPVVQKAAADEVDTSGLEQIKVPSNPPKPPKEWPDVVAQPLPHAEPVQPEIIKSFDNTRLTQNEKLSYLAEIEKIALATGHQIEMRERVALNGQPNGLISCIVYNNGSPTPNPFKGFTIDTGTIIDRRVKMFPAIIAEGYEDLQAYAVMTPVKQPDRNGKMKNKNAFNAPLFEAFFAGGVDMLDERQGMYTPALRELNKDVALITMPINRMSGEVRKEVRERLMKTKELGIFDQCRQIDPNSRFRMIDYEKDKTFKLTNVGCPIRFGSGISARIPIEIHYAKGTATIHYPNGLPQ